MSLFHRHDWHEVGQEYSPPAARSVKATSLDRAQVQKIVYGITNIRERCGACGATRVVTVAGKVPKP